MQISYDVKLPERNSFLSGQKSEEVMTVEAFIQGTQKNMCFTYDEDVEAKRGLVTLFGWRRKHPDGDLVDIFRNGSRVYVVRLSQREVKARRSARPEGL